MIECPDCKGSGRTEERRHFEQGVNEIMRHPSEITIRLAGRKPRSWGHDSIDRWQAAGEIIRAAGLPKEWGQCSACKGEGDIEDAA